MEVETNIEFRAWAGQGELRDAARRREVGVYINGRALERGGPGVVLSHRGMTLGEFFSCPQALRWLCAGARE